MLVTPCRMQDFELHAVGCGSAKVRACYSLWRRGVTYLFKDVSHETPDVTPRRTSLPMPFVRTCLARNTRGNTMSHLTAAGSIMPLLHAWKVSNMRPNRAPPVLECRVRFPVPCGSLREQTAGRTRLSTKKYSDMFRYGRNLQKYPENSGSHRLTNSTRLATPP